MGAEVTSSGPERREGDGRLEVMVAWVERDIKEDDKRRRHWASALGYSGDMDQVDLPPRDRDSLLREAEYLLAVMDGEVEYDPDFQDREFAREPRPSLDSVQAEAEEVRRSLNELTGAHFDESETWAVMEDIFGPTLRDVEEIDDPLFGERGIWHGFETAVRVADQFRAPVPLVFRDEQLYREWKKQVQTAEQYAARQWDLAATLRWAGPVHKEFLVTKVGDQEAAETVDLIDQTSAIVARDTKAEILDLWGEAAWESITDSIRESLEEMGGAQPEQVEVG